MKEQCPEAGQNPFLNAVAAPTRAMSVSLEEFSFLTHTVKVMSVLYLFLKKEMDDTLESEFIK